MAPTETVNMVVAPDILAQDELSLPFLERMGFKQASIPLNPYGNPQRTSKKPQSDDAKHQHRIWGSADSSTSSSTAHSSTSDASHRSPPALHSMPQKAVPTTLAGRKMSASEQDLYASQLTSLISRMKYLSDEGDGHEVAPGVFPVGGSLADQRNMIKAQAAKVRNQFELKFQSLLFFTQMEMNFESALDPEDHSAYNPLRIIRDRNIRPYHHDKQINRANIWQIPVSEQVQDMRWHYHCLKLKAQKMKRRQKKNSTTASSVATPEKHDSFDAMHEHPHEPEANGSPNGPTKNTLPAQTSESPRFSNPFSDSTQKRSLSNDGPTLNLPESTGGELIERLRSSHGAPSDESNLDSSSTSSGASKKSMLFDMHEIDPLSQQPQAHTLQPPNPRRQFCRNSASFSSTRNRFRSTGSGSQSDGNASKLGDDDLLKPLSKVSTNTSQTFSINSQKSSGSGAHEIFNFDTASSSSVSLGMDQAANSNSAQPKPPVVTITSDSGEQKMLDPLKRTPRGGNLGGQKSGSPQKGSDVIHKSANAAGADENVDDTMNICTFGSIRPGHTDVRKAPWERAAHTAEEELVYYILLFQNALRREPLTEARKHILRKYVPEDACDAVVLSLKNQGVPHFLNYLSTVEHKVVNQQQILDADLASSLDALRVTTDRMVSEVNTTLNKQVREISSRMEKLSAKNGGLCTNATYTLLEYFVLSLMWVIWCVVKVWRFFTSGFEVLRGGCNMLIIA